MFLEGASGFKTCLSLFWILILRLVSYISHHNVCVSRNH